MTQDPNYVERKKELLWEHYKMWDAVCSQIALRGNSYLSLENMKVNYLLARGKGMPRMHCFLCELALLRGESGPCRIGIAKIGSEPLACVLGERLGYCGHIGSSYSLLTDILSKRKVKIKRALALAQQIRDIKK